VVIAVASWGESLDEKLPKGFMRIHAKIQTTIDEKEVSKIQEKIKAITEKNYFLIAIRILAFLIFCGVIAWVFVLNFWIIFKVKWLHIFYTFLLAMTMIAIFNYKTHIALFDGGNYKKLFDYIKCEYNNFVETLLSVKNKIRKVRKEESAVNAEKIS